MKKTSRPHFRSGWRTRRSGQSTVEYMLLISVLVIGLSLIFTSNGTFTKDLQDGLHAMQDNISTVVEDGVVDGGQ